MSGNSAERALRITAIRQQERFKSRYSVYINEKYAFSLSADALLAERLVPGQELDPARVRALKKLSADDKAYNLALAYVVRRQRSRYELAEYFRRKSIDAELSQQIVRKLETLGLVDDEKFAESWVRNRRLLKPVSKRRLAAELRAKRVADGIIQRVLREDEADDQAVLRDLIAHKRRQTRYQNPQKLMQYLARQGFGYDDIKSALQEQQD